MEPFKGQVLTGPALRKYGGVFSPLLRVSSPRIFWGAETWGEYERIDTGAEQRNQPRYAKKYPERNPNEQRG